MTRMVKSYVKGGQVSRLADLEEEVLVLAWQALRSSDSRLGPGTLFGYSFQSVIRFQKVIEALNQMCMTPEKVGNLINQRGSVHSIMSKIMHYL